MTGTFDPSLFLPMFAMFAWTVCMFGRMAFLRFNGVRTRKVSAKYFEMFKGEVPQNIQLAANNVNNLMQVPTLFYIICLFIMTAGLTDSIFMGLAFSYVGLRVAHSCIHVTYNKVIHRFIPFFFSNLLLFVMWVRVFILLHR